MDNTAATSQQTARARPNISSPKHENKRKASGDKPIEERKLQLAKAYQAALDEANKSDMSE
jgi:hypothetical protein